jgi:hypothetical protein
MPSLSLNIGLNNGRKLPFGGGADPYPQTLTISSAWWSTRDSESIPDNRTNISFARGQIFSENTSPFPVACDVMYTANFYYEPFFMDVFVGFGLVTSNQTWTHWYGSIASEDGQLEFYAYPPYEITNTHASTSPNAFPTSNWPDQGASIITLNF